MLKVENDLAMEKSPYTNFEKRIDKDAANATINRELAALKRMLNLAANQTPPIVGVVPKINMLAENNTREGFFEYHDFLDIREALPEYLYGVVTFAYKFGWRSSEIKNITWDMVDQTLWTVRIEARYTKNKKARTVYLNDELINIFKKLRKELLESNNLQYVFLNAKKNRPNKQ